MANGIEADLAVAELLPQHPGRYPEAVQPVLDHLRFGLCGGNPALYAFVVRWLANLLQGRRNESVLVLQGNAGSGKTLFLRFLMAIVGDRRVRCHIRGARHPDELLVAVDDATPADVAAVQDEGGRSVLIVITRDLPVDGRASSVGRRVGRRVGRGVGRFARAVRDPRAQVEFYRRMCEVA